MFEDGDVFGDGVNLAARLQALAVPGGICISDAVHQAVAERIDAAFRDMGTQRVSNISRPVRVWQWQPGAHGGAEPATDEPEAAARQGHVRFCEGRGGARLAWAAIGSGPPVLKAPNWLNHIEYEWRSPIWGPALAALAERMRLVRFDQRGNGLSDWEVDEISLDAMHDDMAAVADAAGLDRFALLGISQGCAFSIRLRSSIPIGSSGLVLSAALPAGGCAGRAPSSARSTRGPAR